MRSLLASVAALMSLAAVESPAGQVQGAVRRPVALTAPSAVLDEQFTRVAGIRELRDSRTLVLDAGEKRLVVIDWSDPSVRQLGREGSGPAEYRQPNALFALSGDSSLLVDAIGGRWLVLSGASIVTTISDAPALRLAQSPLGADLLGNVAATAVIGAGPITPSNVPRTDSVHLLRISRAAGRTDTLGRLKSRPTRLSVETGQVGGRASVITRIIPPNPLSVGEQAVIFADGWLAVARLEPYRVDWIRPDGRVLAGRPLPFDSRRVDDREKRVVLQRAAEASGRGVAHPDSVADWPPVMPPFLSGALLAGPDGRVWIRRTRTASDNENAYDVVARDGQLARRVTMDAKMNVVGFGARGLYVVRTDDDGIQQLSIHPLM